MPFDLRRVQVNHGCSGCPYIENILLPVPFCPLDVSVTVRLLATAEDSVADFVLLPRLCRGLDLHLVRLFLISLCRHEPIVPLTGDTSYIDTLDIIYIGHFVCYQSVT